MDKSKIISLKQELLLLENQTPSLVNKVKAKSQLKTVSLICIILAPFLFVFEVFFVDKSDIQILRIVLYLFIELAGLVLLFISFRDTKSMRQNLDLLTNKQENIKLELINLENE